MREFLLLGFGAILALMGSLVQAIVGRTYSQSERRRELLIDAYSDYLTGLAKRASILTHHSERTEEATALMVSGKQKISTYAPAPVVTALANLEKTPMLLSNEITQKAMVELVKAMRKSIRAGSGELDDSIHAILFSMQIIDQVKK
ncbi:MAG: hypothetical protein Tsb0010_03600 [Parvularculaceae bacterium]